MDAATEPGAYAVLDLGPYPGMVVCNDTASPPVQGEVWNVSPAALAAMDAFEGVQHGLFTRTPVRVEGLQHVQAYLYTGPVL